MINLTPDQKETIINFNEDKPEAIIFTYNKTWQKHLEGRPGLKPVMNYGFGGKEYCIDKRRIKPPRALVKLSERAKQERAKRLVDARRNPFFDAKIL